MVHIKDSTKLTPIRCCAFPAMLRDLRRFLPLAFHLITDTSSAQCCHEDAGVRAHLCSVVSHGASCERAWCGFLEHCSSIPGDHIARKRTVADCGLLGPALQTSQLVLSQKQSGSCKEPGLVRSGSSARTQAFDLPLLCLVR